MLFRHLTIDGVGPFGGRHEIEMDALTAGGLFLLEGPTGSGKSSLIDAIVFALYGDTAGDESDYSRIRSTHADPTKTSRVELIFTVSSGTYRIERTPRWDKPKRTGGTTQVATQAILMRLSEVAVEERQWNSGEVLATGAREVGIELTNIIGLTRAQFVQTVVLPQGQFADFLRLKSEDRSKLLETLFNTGPYREFSRQLHQQAIEASQAIEKKREKLSRAVATWLGNSAVGAWEDQAKELEATLTETDDRQLIDFLAQCQEDLTQREEAMRAKSHKAGQALEKASSDLAAQNMLAQLLTKRSELLAQQTTLAAEKPAMTVNRQRIDLHHRAVVPMERLRAWEKVKQEKLDCEQAVADVLEPLQMSYDEASLSTTTKQLGDKTDKYQERLVHLRELALIEEQQTERTQNISKLKEKIAGCDERLIAVNERHSAIPQELADAEKALTVAQKTAEELPEIKGEQEKLNHIAELLEEKKKLAVKVAQAETTYAQLAATVTEKSTHFHELNQRWVASQAAILSQELQPQSPCPVCGSCEHPQPAEPGTDHVATEDVELAQEELEKARTKLSAAQTTLSSQQTQLDSLAEQVKNAQADDVSQQLAQLAKRYDQAGKAKKHTVKLRNDIAQLHAEKEEISAQRSEFQTAKEAAQESLATENGRYATAQEKLDEALSDEEDGTQISDLIGSNKKWLSSLEQATQVVREFAQAITREQTAKESLDQALVAADLTAEKVAEGFLEAKELEELQADIQRFDSAVNYVKEQLATPEIAELTGEEKPEVAQAQTRYEEAKEAQQQAAQEAAIAHDGTATAQRAAEAVTKAFNTWGKEVAKSGPLARLDQLAQAGKASHTNVSLHVWVLVRRFDMVIDFANDYLSRFSGGRYELIRSSGGEKERKTGLGLSIIDHDARGEGESDIRSTRSLSGGETFYTALSLALGLTDVVQQENGGIRIDTLMIDEGFGTLSSEILDEVMTTLTELAGDGRKVGIISHVEELKSRIPNQIRITPAKGNGSTINVIS